MFNLKLFFYKFFILFYIIFTSNLIAQNVTDIEDFNEYGKDSAKQKEKREKREAGLRKGNNKGFFYRLGFGLGPMNIKENFGNSSPEFKNKVVNFKSGLNVILFADIGSAVNKNLVLFGSLKVSGNLANVSLDSEYNYIPNYSLDFRNSQNFDKNLVYDKNDFSFKQSTISFGLSYYFLPSFFYITPRISILHFSTLTVNNRNEFPRNYDYDYYHGYDYDYNYYSKSIDYNFSNFLQGYGLSVGYEWWITANWGMGISIGYERNFLYSTTKIAPSGSYNDKSFSDIGGTLDLYDISYVFKFN